MNKEKLLLHSCCAPCAAYIAGKLAKDFILTLFFYNPNIQPKYEYTRRLSEIKRFAKAKGIGLIEAEYDAPDWFNRTVDHAADPEKGGRCGICFSKRLEKTARFAKENNFDIWGTTLSSSPHKSASVINCIGKNLEDEYNIAFLESDFKKQDGFKKSMEIARVYDFYRQDYCGCLYSQIR